MVFDRGLQSASGHTGKPSEERLLNPAATPPSRTPSTPLSVPRSRFNDMLVAPFAKLLIARVAAAGVTDPSEPSGLNVRLTELRTRRLPAVPPAMSPSSMPKRNVQALAPVRTK